MMLCIQRNSSPVTSGRKRQCAFFLATLFTSTLIVGGAIRAQETAPKGKKPDEIPPVEEITLTTADRQEIVASFYPGTRDKESLAVIMLHRWNADEPQRAAQTEIALALQKDLGAAVIVPDLRGHGRSAFAEDDRDRDISRWRAPLLATVVQDIEACKKFLVRQNNDGKLNVDMLAVIAEQELAILAAIWTITDWSYLPIAGKKQGQDVKALVFLNPVRSFNGLNGNDAYRNALYNGGPGLGFPILVAENSREEGDASTLHGVWERSRKKFDEVHRHLEWVSFRVENQKQVYTNDEDVTLPLSSRIGEFLQKEIIDRQHDFRWSDRSIR
jgi:hypothetical protein